MTEVHLYCKEHGYLGWSTWTATVEYLIAQHLQLEGEHHLSQQIRENHQSRRETTDPPIPTDDFRDPQAV